MKTVGNWPPADISPEDRDLILKIRAGLLDIIGGRDAFEVEMVSLVRLAIDEVIDPARSGRFRFDELEQTEKAYIGVRTEILFRNKFSLDRGTLDVVIAGEDVDIKNTTQNTWMIPTHSVDKPCLLIRSDVKSDPGNCSVGLAIARDAYLNKGSNQDRKRTFQAAHLDKIHWLFFDKPFPANVLERLTQEAWRDIVSAAPATLRVAMMFRQIQRVPVPRHIVAGVARQHDAMKRVRLNGGARDLTEPDGLYILSYTQQRKFIELLGLPEANREHFISISPKTDEEKAIIADYLASEGR